eukprot:CAMPEP_0114597314 /NCGR_PEP_ID=MMETSP0125-20121206/19562_1 /TAXON_ID=485358 ORGANISM="Aristerostoma sp., Strain ATCC 50986" /NCGR_SAMPLE_ID=MMETSP0125 /ASSEMBLY_ACC=CAM_ASM_000245 /LENGTH=71 /DNA_ID=CAMNT_0001801677 /DNA_START=23 /DNA_END=238 /DNA_ORIENTATION=-
METENPITDIKPVPPQTKMKLPSFLNYKKIKQQKVVQRIKDIKEKANKELDQITFDDNNLEKVKLSFTKES